MLGGGKSREWLRPLTPEGRLDTDDPNLDDMVGCHKGDFVGLNVINPDPGFEYVWELNRPRDIMRAKMRGGIRVGADEPESAAMAHLTDSTDTPVDGYHTFGDVTLFKYPIDKIAKIRAEESARAQAMMRGGAAEFVSKATKLEQEMSRGQATRFKARNHGLQYLDGQENVVDTWNPGDDEIRES